MKVRLKLNYNEYKALIFILAKIAFAKSDSVSEHSVAEHIHSIEARNLFQKLSFELQERPKKHYVVTLNSIQVIVLFYRGGAMIPALGQYERTILQDIRFCIDKQHVIESHHRQLRLKELMLEFQGDFHPIKQLNS